ncbi:ribonuclease H2, subunit C [Rhodocollybia butyracea]|uniref:Ribonuclease H2, subunit C n=1 Tax=Rhodocollybia butyracea TaxID=206335 RepID=A0A9P5Q870_9AGAR|nr:ribonuclease H2, subunit C [Rhodocollybia butyracea]
MVSSTKAPVPKRHSRISIASSVSKVISQCTPYLMPFHISYTGPAPVSTYFRVEDAKTHVGCPEASVDNSSEKNGEETSADAEDASSKPEVASSEPSEQNGASSSSTEDKPGESGITLISSDSQPRFTSTFRGRTVHGLKVDLPEGYTGVVFRSDDEEPGALAKGKGKGKATKQEERKSTRRSTRSRKTDEEETMDVDEEETDEVQSTLELVPSSQFKSFVLWHPDIPVDTGKDEYLSSIGEWMKIANVLHQAPK